MRRASLPAPHRGPTRQDRGVTYNLSTGAAPVLPGVAEVETACVRVRGTDRGPSTRGRAAPLQPAEAGSRLRAPTTMTPRRRPARVLTKSSQGHDGLPSGRIADHHLAHSAN